LEEEAHNAIEAIDPELRIELVARASRNACTPDVARELARIWYDSDVRGVLPSLQTPTLLLGKTDGVGEREHLEYVASLIPEADTRVIPDGPWTEDDMRWLADQLRVFAGLERPSAVLDTVLTTVMFTDIADSTQMQASIGDHAWKQLVENHHALVREEL